MSNLDTGLHYPIDILLLPKSWDANYVGEYCDLVQSGFACGKHSDDDIGVVHLRPMNVSRNGKIDLTVKKFVPNHYNDRRLESGDVLFNNTNSPELIGKTSFVSSDAAGLAFSNHMTKIKFCSVVDAKFASYQLHFLWMARYYLHSCVKHVNQASISSRDFSKSIPFVVPPLNEQRRIVAKIEELFSELDNGIESLKTARQKLKVYRQALLKHAFDGKLTEEWRKEHAGELESADELLARIQQQRQQRYQQQLQAWQAEVKRWEAGGKEGKRPSKPTKLKGMSFVQDDEVKSLPEIPAGWTWVKYGDLCSVVRNGISKKPVGEVGEKIFRISAVRPMFFDMNDYRIISNNDGEFDAYFLQKGDLVFTRYNGSRRYVGVCAEYKSDKGRLFPDKLVQTRADLPYLNTSYLEKALNCGGSRKFVESKIRTTAGQSGVSGSDIKNIPMPICSLNEQVEISVQLDASLSVLDEQESEIETNLQRAEALRQSILKKAFSGQLVPQDPNDEPASELLKRIQAQKAELVAQAKAAKKSAQKKSSRRKKAGAA